MLKQFTIIILLTATTTSARIFDCGEYNVEALVKSLPSGVFLTLHHKTQSEINIKLPIKEEIKVAPYFGHIIKADILVIKKFNGMQGELKKIDHIKQKIKDPLNPTHETSLQLLKSRKCE